VLKGYRSWRDISRTVSGEKSWLRVTIQGGAEPYKFACLADGRATPF